MKLVIEDAEVYKNRYPLYLCMQVKIIGKKMNIFIVYRFTELEYL